MAASIILTNAGTNIPVFRQRSRTGGDGQSSSTPRISNGRWTSGCSRSSLREKRQKLWRVCAASTANTDIEDLKQAQVKLRQDEQELRRMTDAIPQAIVVQRPDGTPIYANQVTLGSGCGRSAKKPSRSENRSKSNNGPDETTDN